MPATDTISDRAQEIVDEFALFNDWMGRYEHLMELGDDIPVIDDDDKTDDHYVHGCQSDVWIRADYDEDDNVLRFEGDSNAKITKGLAALVIRVLNEQPPEAVESAEFDFLDEIGLQDNLSSQRNNGLRAMIEQMRERARTFRN
ncbi:MAG: Fe-S metabolism protein SufE [Bacteroidetes bacterium SW_9_63_38]|nr:MAG: Fe-S metabolism protein SufE [Bacteroidetes bacterium SW_9_63_38]